MDIRLRLREILLEGKHNHKNEYGCVLVNLDVNKDEWESILGLIDKEDLYEPEGDSSYGLEKQPHVTALFGLHSEVSDKDVEDVIIGKDKPNVKFSGVSLFKGKEFDVLKFDVDSKDMHSLNKELRKLPHTNTFPKYHPHVTICYLKTGLGGKYVKKLGDNIDIKMTPDHFIYSKVDGSEKKYEFK